jgi:hypothetical protein
MQTVPLNQMADTTQEHLAGADAKVGAFTAHGITRVGLAKVSGQHLSDSANEPEHTDAWHRRNDAQALAIQQQYMDVLRRVGAI